MELILSVLGHFFKIEIAGKLLQCLRGADLLATFGKVGGIGKKRWALWIERPQLLSNPLKCCKHITIKTKAFLFSKIMTEDYQVLVFSISPMTIMNVICNNRICVNVENFVNAEILKHYHCFV